MNFRLLFCFFVLVLLSSACKKETPDPVIAILVVDEYTPERNLIIGNAIDAEIQNIYPTLSSSEKPEAMEYINKMLNILINTPTITNRLELDWEISIIPDTLQTTAFTLPNGHIYVSSGLLMYMETESQLLSLLAHEIAYAEKGFTTLQLDNEFGGEALGDILLDNGKANLFEMATELPNLVYEESTVLAADEFSVEVLCPFLYEPRGIVKIVEKSMSNPSQTISWLDSKNVQDKAFRISSMNALAQLCGLDGAKNKIAYQEFLEDLL